MRRRRERIPTTYELRALLGPHTSAVHIVASSEAQARETFDALVRVVHTLPVDSVENEQTFSPASPTGAEPVAERDRGSSPQIA